MSPSILGRCAVRWVMHLHDPLDAAAFGVHPTSAAPAIPGRLVVAGLGAAAQVIAPSVLPARSAGPAVTGPPLDRVGTLPTVVASVDMPQGSRRDGVWNAALGIGFADLEPVMLEVGVGDHLLVTGSARSGTSNVLDRLIDTWADAWNDDAGAFERTASWSAFGPRRSYSPTSPTSARAAFCPTIDEAVDRAMDAVERGRSHLLVIDDADLVDDTDGRLAALVAGRAPGLVIAAGARSDALRHLYGHWTAGVRRSRMGVIATAGADLDGDLLGTVLPRRLPIAARPGLAYVVGNGRVTLTQIGLARTDPAGPGKPKGQPAGELAGEPVGMAEVRFAVVS
jgi:S-DNA-T family DNA segregation ATPase FtsK/SpoIIIE